MLAHHLTISPTFLKTLTNIGFCAYILYRTPFPPSPTWQNPGSALVLVWVPGEGVGQVVSG